MLLVLGSTTDYRYGGVVEQSRLLRNSATKHSVLHLTLLPVFWCSNSGLEGAMGKMCPGNCCCGTRVLLAPPCRASWQCLTALDCTLLHARLQLRLNTKCRQLLLSSLVQSMDVYGGTSTLHGPVDFVSTIYSHDPLRLMPKQETTLVVFSSSLLFLSPLSWWGVCVGYLRPIVSALADEKHVPIVLVNL